MTKTSKRLREIRKKITGNAPYDLASAISLAKDAPTKFDASIELHLKLSIDPKKSDQLIRGTVQLPHGTGKDKKVIAFVNPDQEADAQRL